LEDRNAHEADPDYRFTLANERTFLAWIRTALGMLAGAVALVYVLPAEQVSGAQRSIAGVLTALSIATALLALRRWHTVQSHMRRGMDLPANRDPIYLSLAITGIAVVMGVLLVWFRGHM
jgi:putative membrane protein